MPSIARLLVFAALIFAPLGVPAEAKAGKGNPTPALPSGNPAAWVTSQDVQERLKDIHGATDFMLWVGANGRVTECTIKKSSGSSELDQLTCALITKRARFVSATDNLGNKVPCPWSSSIHWG